MECTNILIVKFGALGDVVRTAYFPKYIKEKQYNSGKRTVIWWLTMPSSVPLIRFNPYIDIISTNINELTKTEFDIVYSLDDEDEILDAIRQLKFRRLIGACKDTDGQSSYCKQAGVWFDMGLLSIYGKNEADRRKKANQLSHAEIFSGIFDTEVAEPNFYNTQVKESYATGYVETISQGRFCIGINAFAGGRWHSKALPADEFVELVRKLSTTSIYSRPTHLFLFGAGRDAERNQQVANMLPKDSHITIIDTTSDVLDMAAFIKTMDAFITTDSLALHLAISQKVPTLCFFSSTSAAEIESLPYISKVISTHPDYCNYRPDADNSTITCKRLIGTLSILLETINTNRNESLHGEKQSL